MPRKRIKRHSLRKELSECAEIYGYAAARSNANFSIRAVPPSAHTNLSGGIPTKSVTPRKDPLRQLIDLNLEVAARIDRGDPVTAPGVPPNFSDPESPITDDCIRPAK
jgi:hypothetical protein